MTPILEWWLLATIASAKPTESPRPACTAQALSDGCAYFRRQRRKRLIEVGDGTAYLNPAFEAPTEVAPPDPSGARELDAARAEADVQRAWRTPNGSHAPPVTDVFRAAFTRVATSPAVRAGLGLEPDDEPAPVILPWPPTDDDALPRAVSPAELATFLKRLPTATRQRLSEGVRHLTETQPLPEAGADEAPPSLSPHVSPARERRITELTEFARRELLAKILPEGRDYKSLNAADRSQFDRIRTVHVTPMSLAAANPECAKATPTAAYYPERHEFTICPNAANQPDAFRVHVIAHEIDHSNDGCASEFPLVEVDRAKLAKLNPVNPPTEITADADRSTLFQAILDLPPESKYMTVRLSAFADPKVAEYFEKLGVLKEVAAPIAPADNPQRDVAKCLVDAGIRGVTPTEIEHRVDLYVKRRVRRATKPIDAAALKANALKSALRYPGCMGGERGDTRLNEAGADAAATPVTARWLKLHPPRNAGERIAVFGPTLSEFCGPQSPDERVVVSADEVMDATSVEKMADPHPGDVIRVNDIVLRDPGVQAALNCEPTPGAKACTTIPRATSAGGDHLAPPPTPQSTETSR